MLKCIAVKTAEDKLEPTAQANSVATALKLAVLEKLAMQNFAPNDEIWITESGEWEVPYDGIYDVLIISGGSGGCISAETNIIYPQPSGDYIERLFYFTKGQIIPVTIGAGGTGLITTPTQYQSDCWGGDTVFNGVVSGHNGSERRYLATGSVFDISTGASWGPGFGGGSPYQKESPFYSRDGQWWGASGGAIVNGDTIEVGNGKQGAVRARFFNPTKVSLPTINDTDLIPYINLLQRLEAIEAQLNINS